MNRGLPSSSDARSTRGSVLIVSLILATIMALSLGTYLSLSLHSTRLAKRTFYGYAALNLGEGGAEHALHAFNRSGDADPDAWTGWTKERGAAMRRFSDFEFTQNTKASVQVYVDTYQPGPDSRPRVVALATVEPANDLPVTRMLEVTLRRRSLFANGLVALNSVTFNGTNASVDSWNSDPDGTATTAPLPYTAATRNDRGTVASLSVVNNAVLVNQAHVWGYVFTGGGQPQVGSLGSVRGSDTPAEVRVDPTRIATDFNADLPMPALPLDGTPIVRLGATLGVPGTSTKWRSEGISLTGSETLTILGDVTIVLPAGSGAAALSVAGTAGIVIPEGSTLTIYIEGNMRVAGRGFVNLNPQPAACIIYGTNAAAGGQSFAISGGASLLCAVYAPNADVTLNGNGDIMGSVIAANITLNGNAAFHFDEALGALGDESFGISGWKELTTPAERGRYEALFQGW